MSNTNNLRWSVIFSVKKDIFEEFIAWMEEDHIPKIHATGFFQKEYRKAVQKDLGEERSAVQYIHTPYSMEHWEQYNRIPRPGLRNDLLERWKKHIESGDLIMIGLCGPLELREVA